MLTKAGKDEVNKTGNDLLLSLLVDAKEDNVSQPSNLHSFHVVTEK